MSTFYAAFEHADQARDFVRDLIRGGVRSDDISLVSHQAVVEVEGTEMIEAGSTVGDATSFVGREDDPHRDASLPPGLDLTELTSTEMSRLSPVDTSDSATNVDSVDQMDDSQSAMEDMIYPRHGISQGTHETDDVALAVTTGYPTLVPTLDNVRDADGPLQDQLEESLETIVIPGFGTVMGGGSLATAALDFVRPESELGNDPMLSHLKEAGVPESEAVDLRAAFEGGGALVAVAVTPGEVREEAVETLAEQHGARHQNLFDAPLY